jgi:PAS domain S-box-containing protein
MSRRERLARRPWVILALVVLALGALLALLLAWIHGAEATIAHQRATQQLTLVARIVTAQLQQGEYQDVEALLGSIAAADASLDDIELTAGNGFTIASYRRPGVHPAVIAVETTIAYSYRRMARLRLVEDLAPVHAREKSMALQLGGLYVAGSLLLALALRIALQRNAEAQRLRGALQQLHATNRTLRVLSDCNQALVRARSAAELMDSMCRILVEKGGFDLAWIGMAEAGGEQRVRPVAAHGATGYLDDIDVRWSADTAAGNGPAGRAIRSGEPSVSRDVRTEPSAHPWRERAERFGFRSSIALPLGSGAPAYGILSLYSSEPPLHFDADETRLLAELASDLDYGLQALRAEERRREVEQQVERQGKRFRALVEKSADGVAVTDAAGLLLYTGSSIRRPLGYGAGEVLGRSALELVHPEDVREVTKWLSACAAVADSSVEVTTRALHKSGEWRWLDATFTNLLQDPAVGGIVINFRDVTQRRDLQQRLLIEHQRSHVFLRKASDCLHILDAEGRLVDASDSFFAALGWTRAELLGRDPSFWDAEYSGAERAPLIRRVRSGGSLRFETRHRRKDGSVFDVEVAASYFELAGAAYAHCSARDLTEVRKLEREVIGAATREQRRLAYELHDALGQELTAARLLADTFATRATPASPESAAGFRRVSAILDRSLLTARGIVTGLSPLAADQGDLAAGLARLAASSSTSAVQVRLSDRTGGAVAIPVEDRSHLFRIAQEAVQNALKHADARHIDIELVLDGSELQLTVADDGTGITEPSLAGGGHGMYSMRYRCNAIGGRLFVARRPTGGTLVMCSVPNQAREEAGGSGRE